MLLPTVLIKEQVVFIPLLSFTIFWHERISQPPYAKFIPSSQIIIERFNTSEELQEDID